MKLHTLSCMVAVALALHAHAYLDAEDGAFNVRHIHMVERGENGEVVGRAFGNTYNIAKRDLEDLEVRRDCTTVLACGTPGGCMSMAGQTYCKGESWEKSFQKAVSQTGANAIIGLKLMAEGVGRGPIGMLANVGKATAKAIIEGNKASTANKAKAAAKKAAPKKSPPKKAPAKKNFPKKASPKKSVAKKSPPKKNAAKNLSPKKNVAKTNLSPRRTPPRRRHLPQRKHPHIKQGAEIVVGSNERPECGDGGRERSSPQ